MEMRGWLIVGPASAAAGLPTHMALTGASSQPNLPNAGEVEPGRWIVWQPVMTTGPVPESAVTLVCVELSPGQDVRPDEARARVVRLEKAVSTMAWWLVEAQTGFGERDAQGIDRILSGRMSDLRPEGDA